MREAHTDIYTYNNTATDADGNCDLNCDGIADAIADAVRAISYTLTYAYFNIAAASYSDSAPSSQPSAAPIGSIDENKTERAIRFVYLTYRLVGGSLLDDRRDTARFLSVGCAGEEFSKNADVRRARRVSTSH
jgi:hypothetical protein